MRKLLALLLFSCLLLPGADVKISGLPTASAAADANEFEINEAGTSKKVTGAQVRTLAIGNAFVQFSGPSSSIKTYELPNASTKIVTQAVENNTENAISVAVGTSGTAQQKTPATVNPSTGAAAFPGGITTGTGPMVIGGAEGEAPSTPAADHHKLYFDSADGRLKKLDEADVVKTYAHTDEIPALSAPQVTVLLSGTSQTYTTPTGALYLAVEMCGGGGGGGGSGTTPGTATVGGNTTFGSLTANGGSFGIGDSSAAGGQGGTATGGDDNVQGAQGGSGWGSYTFGMGGIGAASPFGGAGPGGWQAAGGAAKTNSCSGGGGAGDAAVVNTGGGGGAGGYVRMLFATPSSTYTYTVGGAGAGGSAGTSGFAGGAGAAGRITVTAYFQ